MLLNKTDILFEKVMRFKIIEGEDIECSEDDKAFEEEFKESVQMEEQNFKFQDMNLSQITENEPIVLDGNKLIS